MFYGSGLELVSAEALHGEWGGREEDGSSSRGCPSFWHLVAKKQYCIAPTLLSFHGTGRKLVSADVAIAKARHD
jgi:hypothetical protein